MKILAEISEASLGLGEAEKLGEHYELRKSARAILLNEQGKMATQYLQTYTFHKLPGGGVEPGESLEEAVLREVKEEVGCDAKINDLLGVVIEYRTGKYNMIQISYAFSATVVGEVGTPHLEEGEKEEGQITLWLPPAMVLEKMKTDQAKKHEGHFILKREMAFLEEYLRIIG